MDPFSDRVRSTLVEIASHRSLITYSELADIVSPNSANELYNSLKRICRYEHSNRRPLLSALAVNPNWGIPGRGFFTTANEIAAESKDFELCESIQWSKGFFWYEEVQRVYDYWSRE